MKCPTCEATDLVPRKTAQGTLLQCPTCGFILADNALLEAYSDDRERFRKSYEEANTYRLATARACPKCLGKLQQGRSKTAGLILTFCPTCRLLWVDFRSLAVFDRALERALREQVQAAAETAAPAPFEAQDDDSLKPNPFAKVLKSMAKSLEKTADRLGANIPPDVLKKQEQEAKRRRDEEKKKKEEEKRKKEAAAKAKKDAIEKSPSPQRDTLPVPAPPVAPPLQPPAVPAVEPVAQKTNVEPPVAPPASKPVLEEEIKKDPVAEPVAMAKPEPALAPALKPEPTPESIPEKKVASSDKAPEPPAAAKPAPVSRPFISQPGEKAKKPGFFSQLFSGPKKPASKPAPKPAPKPVLPPSISVPKDSEPKPVTAAEAPTAAPPPIIPTEPASEPPKVIDPTPTPLPPEPIAPVAQKPTAVPPKVKKPGFWKQLFTNPNAGKPKPAPKPMAPKSEATLKPATEPLAVESLSTESPKPAAPVTIPQAVEIKPSAYLKKSMRERMTAWAPRFLSLGALLIHWLTAYEFEWLYAVTWMVLFWSIGRMLRLWWLRPRLSDQEKSLQNLREQTPATSWRGVPVLLKGILGQRVIVQDGHSVPFDRTPGWDIVAALFAVSNFRKWVGQPVEARGWYRGGKSPYLEIKELRCGVDVRKSLVGPVQWTLSILVCFIASIILYSGY